MNLLALLALEAIVLVLSIGMMRSSLRRPGSSVFSAVPAGLLVPFLLAVMGVVGVYNYHRPEMAAERSALRQASLEAAKTMYPALKPAEVEASITQMEKSMGFLPALSFCLQAALIAAIGVWLRWRETRLGRAPKPEPMAHWTAPFWMVWLVLGPFFWGYGLRKGQFHGWGWPELVAANAFVVGLVLYLFQGMIVYGAKLSGFARDPQTRGLALLMLGLLLLLAVYHDGVGLFISMIVLGIFEPWSDLRHLNAPAKDPGAAS